MEEEIYRRTDLEWVASYIFYGNEKKKLCSSCEKVWHKEKMLKDYLRSEFEREERGKVFRFLNEYESMMKEYYFQMGLRCGVQLNDSEGENLEEFCRTHRKMTLEFMESRVYDGM